MIKQSRFIISRLPFIPTGAQFMLGGKYAKINENDHLELYERDEWNDYEKTLTEYNTYWIKSRAEYSPREYVEKVYNRFPKEVHFYFDPATDQYYVSYNKPVQKGTVRVDGVDKVRMKAGEATPIYSESIQIRAWIDDNNGYVNLEKYEHSLRMQFEHAILITGTPIEAFSDGSYYDSVLTDKYYKYLETEFYKAYNITLEKE